MSIGSDSGGSIRWPAACTGIAGLMPTRGLVPGTGNPLGIFANVLTYGPLARYIDDLALSLSIIAGPDSCDPHCLPLRSFPSSPPPNNLRVAFFTDDGVATPTQEIQEITKNAALALKDEVGYLEENRPDCLDKAFRLVWETIFLGGDRGQGLKTRLRNMGSHSPSPLLEEIIHQSEGCEFSVTELYNRLVEIDLFRIEMLSFMKNYDVLLCPVAATPAKLHGKGLKEIRDFSYTMAHNLTGWPVAVVRCGTSKEGLPIGVQVVSTPCQDQLVLRIAKRLETLCGGYKPPEAFGM